MIISFKIENGRGIVSAAGELDGRSARVKGHNGAGKSSLIDLFWWGLGGSLPGEVVRVGAEKVETEITIRDGKEVLTAKRRQVRDKPATITLEDADKRKLPSPTSRLQRLSDMLARRQFSALKPAEQAALLRRLVPGLDVSDLETKRAKLYEERTGIGRVVESLKGQLDGISIPDAPAVVGEELDLAAIAAKKGEAATAKAANDRAREAAKRARAQAHEAVEDVAKVGEEIARLQEKLKKELERAAGLEAEATAAEQRAANLADPDTAEIDREVERARAHNATVAAARRAQESRAAAQRQREDVAKRLTAEREKQRQHTEAIAACDEEKRARLAACDLPVPGLSIEEGLPKLDRGAGPVAVEDLSDGERIKLDILIAARLGHRMIPIRHASLLDAAARAEIERFGEEHGMQLFFEEVTSGELEIEVIEEEL